MIKMLDINKITAHPDNPRKELGDLQELADSIKESGILQNLTVAPHKDKDDTYTVIIGHRRLSAAKQAGLKEVPCAIVEMDDKTQVATMLLENMQRVDLTIYEQAQGFQMMIDLGEGPKEISEKTGFSESTVRRRIKLLELDKDKFKESTSREIKMEDYMKLFEIEDPELRDEVLERAGTEDFNWALDKAKRAEKQAKWEKHISDQLDKFAKRTDQLPDGYAFIKTYWYTKPEMEIEIPRDAKERGYLYIVYSYGQITLCGQEDESESLENKEKREAREARHKKQAEANELMEMSESLIRDFIYNKITEANLIKKLPGLIKLMMGRTTSLYIYSGLLQRVFGLDDDYRLDDDCGQDDIDKIIQKEPALSFFKMLYESEYRGLTYIRPGEYKENPTLDKLYDLLISLGYKMSEEEKQIKDGTHQIFNQ